MIALLTTAEVAAAGAIFFAALQQFREDTNVTLVEEAAALFSPEEMRLITIFYRRTGLDYGEIDVVRDHETSLIYVLDINKTPLGPPNGLSKADHVHALRLYRKHFAAMIEIWPQRLIRA